MKEETRQEGSVPLAARVNVVDLANLAIFWESKGYLVRSASQLTNWSMELLVDALKTNGEIKEPVETVNDAYNVLSLRGIFQKRMKSRKLGVALSFESMRAEGGDPSISNPKEYKLMHPEDRVNRMPLELGRPKPRLLPLPGYPQYLYPEGDEDTKNRLIKQAVAAGIKTTEQVKNEVRERAKAAGVMSESKEANVKEGMSMEEINERQAKIDKEIQEKENTPIDEQLEFLKQNIVKEESNG